MNIFGKNHLIINTILGLLSILVFNSFILGNPLQDDKKLGEWTPKIGGCGGVFFNASQGPLIIEIGKQDLNLSNSITSMRAILIGPDREVIEDMWIPADGLSKGKGIGPEQTLRFETQVESPGLYALMITVSNDSYGNNVIWRFRTNCSKYMIETSRAHRDTYHQEPIVLKDPEREANICFMPQKNSFKITITDLPDTLKLIELKDVHNRQIASLKVENNAVSHSFDKGSRSGSPWVLSFQNAKAKIEIEGVTQWRGNDASDVFSRYPNGSLWTPEVNSWFPILENRWLISPYNRKIYAQLGETKSTAFTIHNNGTESKTILLSLEFPNKKWSVQLSDKEVELAPNEGKEISLTWKSDNADQIVYLRATNGDFSTYSTLYTKVGDATLKSPINIPLVLKPYSHEQEQFGYFPDYPVDNQLYFNIDNKPFVRTSKQVASLKDGEWKNSKVGNMLGSIISFDSHGNVYTLAKERDQAYLMRSKDNGLTFDSYKVPGNSQRSSFDIEQFTGHNIIIDPPPITRYSQKGVDEKHFWRRYGDLELLIPRKSKNGIEWEKPILISEKCLGVSSHSGIPSSIVSRGSKIFLCWGEVSDPDVSKDIIPGVPVYVTSYDRLTKQVEKPVLVGYGAPPNDVHNIPGITIDSEGFLHVLTGTHGSPFHYTRSNEPESTNKGWTEPVPLMETKDSRSTQTYLGMVTGLDNTLHLVFRLWRYNTEYFPDSYFASLAYMNKEPDKPWSDPQILVVAPFSEYSVYKHRLTIDRKGKLFIHYNYWSTYWFYRNDRSGNIATVLMSGDNGNTWKLLDDEDLQP